MQRTSAVIAAVACAGAAEGQAVQVRDGPGGMSSYGEPSGYYVSGLASRVVVSIGGGPLGEQPIGALGAELDTAFGFAPLPTYCLEPSAELLYGLHEEDPVGVTYFVGDIETLAGLDALDRFRIEVLWANVFELSLTGPVESGAFQLILWELAEDNAFDLAAGAFRVDTEDPTTAEIAALAEAWWELIVCREGDDCWTDSTPLDALFSPSSQDLVTPRLGCPADLDGDEDCDLDDLNVLLFQWGTAGPEADIDGDGTVGLTDLNVFLAFYGPGS